jgi:phage shock protein PspC (stress-responsive transcriptional regulator)
MEQNFDPRRRRRLERLNEKLETMPRKFNKLRINIRRSPNGIALGVFRGVAERFGWSVCWTRILGVFLLLAVSSGDKGSSLLVAGFFYLLAAVLMRPPDASASRLPEPGSARYDAGDQEGADYPAPPYTAPRSAGRTARPAAVPFERVIRPRVDFVALNRQLDLLDRRIQRMEGVVTDRHYDWDRRMES